MRDIRFWGCRGCKGYVSGLEINILKLFGIVNTASSCLFVREDGTLVLLDFEMVKRLSGSTKRP